MRNFRLLIACSFLLTVSAVIYTGCAKEYSFEGGNSNVLSSGTAVYTWQGAGGECLGSVISGNYYTATSLTALNTIALKVHVTTTGTYVLNTGSINNFQFSGSGSFADTGVQVITLTGSGSPGSEGNFTFNTPGSSGCSFTILVTSPPVQVGGFTLAGAPNSCERAVVNGTYLAGTGMNSFNNAVLKVDVTALGPYQLNTDTLDGISFSATGNFTATGLQTITLTATGTPLLPRNLTFTPKTNSSYCTFAVAVLNPAPLATYVLESGLGNPNPCIYEVSGDYIAGQPLSVSNTVSIHVFVSEEGNFTIATETKNGMTFSYTGTFATKGPQEVLLTGSGTPANPGTFTLIPQIVGPSPLGGESCGIDIKVM